MSLTVRALNGDTAFLFTFNPPSTSPSSPPDAQPSFTILVDPWLVGAATILSSVFSISERKTEPCISSLKELRHEPDIILISQAKPDHCHEETLRQLPTDCQSTILATPAAAKKIRSWKHFQPELIQTLPRYDQADAGTIYRLALPPLTPRGSCGEVTIAWIPAKRDIAGVHHAIGITYRPPCSESPSSLGRYLELPMSPPPSPGSPITISSSPRTIVPSPNNDRERTLSVIYSPHGVPWSTIRPYATSHLVNEAALPLSVFLHSFDCVENPWYLGGNISAGSPGGFEIARHLYARSWISAHDADKNNRGISVKQVRIGKYTVNEIQRMLLQGQPQRKGFTGTNLVTLGSGDEHRVEVG